MNSKANANVIVLIIIIVIALALAGGGFYLFQKEHARNAELTSQLEDLSTKQKIAEAKLRDSQKIIDDLGLKLKDSSAQIEALNIQLQQEKSTKEEALAKLEQIKTDLTQQKESRSDLEKKLSKAQDDARSLQTKLGAIEIEKAKLEAKIKDLEAKSKVELGKIVVSPEQAAQPASQGKGIASEAGVKKAEASRLEGKVLVLNKEYNFVVINLGNKDGVVVGEQFALYHGDKYLGDVKVEKVQDIMSAAGFLSDEVKNKAREGDKVVKKSR